MTQLLLPLAPGYRNQELRYAARSWGRHITAPSIFTVGSADASWFSREVHLEAPALATTPKTLANHLKEASKSPELAEEFLLVNDDMFLFRQWEGKTFWSGSTLEEHYHQHQELHPDSAYAKSLKATYGLLQASGIETPLDFELHVPMPMSKAGLQAAVAVADQVKTPVQLRSIYGNLHHSLGDIVALNDVKLRSRSAVETWTKPFLSTDELTWRGVKDLLESEFPEQSRWEK